MKNMLDIIIFEFIKVWSKRGYRLLIVVMIFVNIYLLYYTNKPYEQEYSLTQYGQLNAKLNNMDSDKREEYICKLYEMIHGVYIVEQIKMYEAQNSDRGNAMADELKSENPDAYAKFYTNWKDKDYLQFTDNIDKEIALVDSFYNEYTKTKDYPKYLEGIQKSADVLSGISIFQSTEEEKNDFSDDNISKTAKAYAKRTTDNIVFSGSEGYCRAIDSKFTDILIAAVIFVLASILINEEKTKGLFFITKSTKNGRTHNILAKLIVLGASTLLITCVFYIANFVYFGVTAGIYELGRNIQSVPEYMGAIIDVNTLEFALLIILAKGVVYIGAALIIMLIAVISDYAFCSLIIYTAMHIYGLVMYSNFSSNSRWNWLKYMNIVGFLKTDKIYGQYMNLNLFNNAVSIIVIFCVVLAILICILISSNIILFRRKKEMIIKRISLNIHLPKKQLFKINSKRVLLLKNEAYKSAIMYKTLIVLILFSILSIYGVNKVSYYSSPNELCYKVYMEKLSGKLDDGKEKYVLDEKDRYQKAFDKLDEIQRMQDDGEIDEDRAETLKQVYEAVTSFYPAFSKVYEKYELVKDNPDTEFVYEKGYYHFFGIGTKSHRTLFLQINIVLIMMLTPVLVMEREKDMRKIIRTTPRGRYDTIRAKVIYSLLVCIIVYIIPLIRNIIICINNYGMGHCLADMRSIGVAGLFGNIPIIICMILFCLAQILCTLLIGMIILSVSGRIDNIVYGMMILICILVLPIIIISA